MPDRFFITGTDTGVGKTLVSALLCAALDAIYWKPIQTGTREGTDRQTVMQIWRSFPRLEQFLRRIASHRLSLRILRRDAPASASICGTSACREYPAHESLIVEGAGGVLVPINETQLMTDLMRRLKLPVMLVCRSSLGTINHTLLSLAALRAARPECPRRDNGWQT